MSETEPQEPEANVTETQFSPLEMIFEKLSAIEQSQAEILSILKAPLDEAASKEKRKAENHRKMKEAIARGDLRQVSG